MFVCMYVCIYVCTRCNQHPLQRFGSLRVEVLQVSESWTRICRRYELEDEGTEPAADSLPFVQRLDNARTHRVQALHSLWKCVLREVWLLH